MGELNARGVDVSGRPARDVVLELLGVDPAVGPLAYWRSHEIHAGVRAVRDQLSRFIDGDLERWWSAATDTDRRELIEQAEVPTVPVARRPWANTKALWGTRIPYIPLSACLHAMAAGGHPTVGATADAHGIGEATNPWELLELLEPGIEPTPFPDDLPKVAGGLRLAMNNQPDDETAVHNPARWLMLNHHAATWDVLAAVAETATAEENERQAQLRADRAAKKAAAS